LIPERIYSLVLWNRQLNLLTVDIHCS